MLGAIVKSASGGLSRLLYQDNYSNSPSIVEFNSHDGYTRKLALNAKNSNSIYGAKTTVQNPAISTLVAIRY